MDTKSYNQDEMESPDWMDKKFFEKVLRTSEKDPSIEICSSKITPGTKPGEHFASIMFRVALTYTSDKFENLQSASFIIKRTIIVEGIKKGLSNDQIFITEIKMYEEVLPEIHRLLKLANESINTPRLIYQCQTPALVIVLEDVSPQGYGTVDIVKSFEEAKIIVADLAKFHAASFVMAKNKTDLTGYDKSMYTLFNKELLHNIVGKSFVSFTNEIKSRKGFEKQAAKFEKLIDTHMDKLLTVYTPNEEAHGYNVLNHGDFHIKNLLMRKMTNDKIKDFVMLDFQICFWGSPAIDLHYFLSCVIDFKTNKCHRDELILFYHEEFSRVLHQIGYLGVVPSLLDLNIELLKHGFLEV